MKFIIKFVGFFCELSIERGDIALSLSSSHISEPSQSEKKRFHSMYLYNIKAGEFGKRTQDQFRPHVLCTNNMYV